jgi:hypothetical protein
MILLYNVTQDKQFGSKVEWFLEIDVEMKVIEWILYPHAPAGMHPKLADNHNGMGFIHKNGKQSVEDFKLNPKYDINEITHGVSHAIADDYANDVANVQNLKALLGTNIFSLKRVGGHINPRYRGKLNEEELFTIEKLSELEIIRLDLLIQALSEQ